jgi:hypothetical protein
MIIWIFDADFNHRKGVVISRFSYAGNLSDFTHYYGFGRLLTNRPEVKFIKRGPADFMKVNVAIRATR